MIQKISLSLCALILCLFTACHSYNIDVPKRIEHAVKTILPPKPNLDAEVVTSFDVEVERVDADEISRPKRLSNNYVLPRIEAMMGDAFRHWCAKAKVNYPPEYVLLRAFKLEGELELWGGNSDENLKLLTTLEICAADFDPGPKLKQGDWKTPEGFYPMNTIFDSKLSYMWIDLDDESLFSSGEVGQGSSFKLHVLYPNNYDRQRTRTHMGKNVSTGGEICLHGNCASAGCISFQNNLYASVFWFSQQHNRRKYGTPEIHIFPFRFTEELKTSFAKYADKMSPDATLSFWNNLEEGYRLFNRKKQRIRWTVNKNGYVFKR